MHFFLLNTDRPGSLDLRMATRPAHLEYLETHAGKIVTGGAVLDASGQPSGSMLVVDLEDRAAAEAFAAADPYARAGLFECSIVRPFRQVFRDGARLS